MNDKSAPPPKPTKPAAKIGTSYVWTPEEISEAKRIISERKQRRAAK